MAANLQHIVQLMQRTWSYIPEEQTNLLISVDSSANSTLKSNTVIPLVLKSWTKGKIVWPYGG